MSYSIKAQAIDSIVRGTPGITEREMTEMLRCDPSGTRKNCQWLVSQGHVVLVGGTGPDRAYRAA